MGFVDTTRISIGKISTNDLVGIFGTKKMREKCDKGGYIGGREKELLLTKAKKYCDIEDLGQGKYIIKSVNSYNPSTNNKQDQALAPLKKGLYNYLAPLILSKLLEDDNQFKITLPFLGWAKKFDMVNENYSLLKYNQGQGVEKLDIDADTMFEYFERMDDCIKYYLQECLAILGDRKGLDLIDFDSIKMVKKKILHTRNKPDGGIEITCEYIDEIVSDDDRKFVYECEIKAKEKAGITNNREKYYGVKSYIYKNELKTLLLERNILFMYSAYNIYCKNLKEVKGVLTKFTDKPSRQKFIKVFNEKFIEYSERVAKNRQKREFKKQEEKQVDEKYLKKYRLTEQYLTDYNGLLDKTVRLDAQSLDIINENDISSILNEFSIDIVKR